MARAAFAIETEGFNAMRRKLKALDELDAPEMASSLDKIARLTDSEVSSRAPGSMGGKVATRPAKKLGATITFGTVKHPGAKSMEFGRTTYYRGYTGRAQKSGQSFKANPGQKARPFVGIKRGDQAMGRLVEPVRRELASGVAAVWARQESDS